MKAFVINLERRKDRYEYIINNYKNDNYTIEIFKAYDGKYIENNTEEYEKQKTFFLNCIENNKQKNTDYPYNMFSEFKKGELGGFLSHLILWKKIIDENIDKVLIFEDDCIFCDNLNSKLENILKELPNNFNIVWLGGKHSEKYSSDLNKKISENLSIFNEVHPYCTFSYIISLEGAKKLYYYAHNIFKGKLGVDFFMFDFFKNNNDIQHTATPHITWSKLGNDEQNTIFQTDIQNE